jgi:hypothetical protein
MNGKKGGAKYNYSNSLINVLAAIHAYLFPCRRIDGFLRVFAEHIYILKTKEGEDKGRRTADHTTVW